MSLKSKHPAAQTPASDTLRTPRAAFETIGVGNTKGWKLIAEGHLEVVRLGKRCTRVRQSSIDRLIQNGVS